MPLGTVSKTSDIGEELGPGAVRGQRPPLREPGRPTTRDRPPLDRARKRRLASAGLPTGHFPYAVLGASVGFATASFTSLRRFWAVAASRNSSDAPANPGRRSLVSFRCRLR